MNASDKTKLLVPVGIYTMRLKAIEGYAGLRAVYTRLSFVYDDETDIQVHLHGSMDHIISWRRCLGQTFQVRILHKTMDDRIYYDARII